jgi:MFS family permease
VGETVTQEVRTSARAWWVVAATMAALVAAAGFRSSTGALLEPLEHEFGWSRGTTSGAVSLNLILYGLTAPFAAALMERFGVRRVVASALALVSLGSGLTLVMTRSWQLWFLWGVPVGMGTGAMALVFGAIVANRWFVRHRGLVTGIFSAASSTGQLIFLPLIAQLAHGPGWRWAAGVVAAFSLLLVPVVLLVLRDRPSDVGELPYGAPASYVDPPVDPSARGRPRSPSAPCAR